MTELAYAEEESPFKKIGGILLTALIMISIVGGAFYYFRLTHPANDLSDHPQTERIAQALKNPKTANYYKDFIPLDTTSKDNVLGARSAPTFNVGRYKVSTQLPFLPAQTKIYTFKTSFPEEETTQLAQKLLAPDAHLVTTEDSIRTYSSSFGYLIFNTKTGIFNLNSVGSSAPFENLRTIADIRPALTNYLQDSLHLIDDSTLLSAYYQRSTAPDITYYEFHRDAQKMGLNIINPIGVINVPENTSLKTASLTSFTIDSASDASIILASDSPGKARRSDFNTLTIGINSAGSIVSIESNLRPIETSEYLAGLSLSILSPDQALEELQNKGSYFNITVPSGQGNIDYDKVYLNNQLKTQEAIITDMVLTFIEKPANIIQRYLQPVYIVRGYAETDSGVRVKFVQTVPAVSALDKEASRIPELNLIKPAFALDQEILIPCPGGSGKCTFETFKNTPTPPRTEDPTPTTVPTNRVSEPTPTTSVPTSKKCVLYAQDGGVLEEGQQIFYPGLGAVYYFSNLPSGPLVVENSVNDAYSNVKDGDPQLVSLTFENNLQAELITLGARAMIDTPYRIAYGNNGLDLKKLYNMQTDIQNLPDISYGNGTGERALYWDYVANTLYSERSNLTSLTHNPTPLHDAGLSNDTIWLARRNTNQLGIHSRTYGSFRLNNECRFVTTMSPLMFFYSDVDRNVRLVFNHKNIAYVDPYLSESFNFTVKTDGKLIFNSNLTRDRLHYEYKNVSFERPTRGWIVKKELISGMTSSIATQLGLIEQESSALLKEVTRSQVETGAQPYVFIGLIDEASLNQKLPFSLSPQPQTMRRVHIYLEPLAASQHISAPQLTHIDRKGFTIIEIGSYVAK